MFYTNMIIIQNDFVILAFDELFYWNIVFINGVI